MNLLTLFGLFAITAMLVCYTLENRSRWFIVAFAAACALGSAYGFLQGGVAIRVGSGCLVYRRGSAMVDCCATIRVNYQRWAFRFELYLNPLDNNYQW